MNAYLKIVLTFAIAFVFVKIFSFAIEKGQRNFHVHKYARMKEIYNGSSFYDILFLGSSRTHGGVYPKMVDSITGLKSYNGGTEGGNLYEFKLTLEGWLVHHPPPKLIVLNIDPMSFDLRRKIFFPIQYFESLGNKVVRNAFKHNKEYRYFFIRYLPFLRLIYYDDYTKSLALRGLMGSNELQMQTGAIENKGFLSLGTQSIDTTVAHTFTRSRLQISREGIACLRAMVDTCRNRNIQLVFGYAPEYNFTWQRSFVNFPEFEHAVKGITSTYDIPYFRDDSLAMCRDARYFAGYGHVNRNGAIEYSKLLGKRIMSLLNNQR